MDLNFEALKVIRERSGLSQSDLARMSGISQGHISGLESGQKKASPGTMKKIADTLGVPVMAIVSMHAEVAS